MVRNKLVSVVGVNPPADIASGRIAEVRSRSMSCNCMTRTSQQECRGILEYTDKDFTQNQVSGNIKNQSEDSMKIKITGIIIMVIFAGTLIFYTCGKNQPQTDNQII